MSDERRPVAATLSPLTFGDLIDLTVRLYRRHLLLFLALSAVLQAPVVLLVTVLGRDSIQGLSRILETAAAGTLGARDAEALLRTLGVILVLGLVLSLVAYLAAAAVIHATARSRSGERATFRDSLAAVVRRGGALIGAWLITTLAVLGLLVAWAFGAALIGLVLGGPTGFVGGGPAGFAVIVYGIVLLVLLVLISVRWSLSTAAIMLEQRGAIVGLRRSWRLVAGSTWRVFAITTMVALTIGLLQAIMSQLAYSFGGSEVDPAGSSTVALQALVSTASTVFFGPVMPILITLLFHDLRLRREGAAVPAGAAQPPPDAAES